MEGGKREEKRGCRERSSDFSLKSMKLWLSFRVGPRLKVGVLIEGNAWTQNSRIFVEDLRRKVQEAVGFELPDLQKVSSSLQEVGNLPTRTYFPSRSRFGLG